MDAVTFGQYLKQLRKAKGLTLVDIERDSGFSHPYLSQIETGKMGIPSPAMLRKLSITLGCTHIGMMIKAGHVTEEEVLIFRKEQGMND